jgi:hypothetical protein
MSKWIGVSSDAVMACCLTRMVACFGMQLGSSQLAAGSRFHSGPSTLMVNCAACSHGMLIFSAVAFPLPV